METWSLNTFLVAVVVMVTTGSLSFEATELEFFPEPDLTRILAKILASDP